MKKMIYDLEQVQEYLRTIHIPLRLSCTTQSGWPMIVSLWFCYQDNKLFCATQYSARVVDYLKNNPRCAFEISADLPPYCGVRGQAIASINEEIGSAVLEKLLVRYLGGTDNKLAKTLLKRGRTEVAIVLNPKNIYLWDFSDRMGDILCKEPEKKFCP